MTQCTSFCLLYDCNMILVMGRYENLRELSVNMILTFVATVKSVNDSSLFFNSRKISKIVGIWHEHD